MGTAMTRRSALFVAFAFAVTTCSAEPAAFYNPHTGAIGQCVSTDLDPYSDKCIATYEEAGWLRFDKPIISRETAPRTSAP